MFVPFIAQKRTTKTTQEGIVMFRFILFAILLALGSLGFTTSASAEGLTFEQFEKFERVNNDARKMLRIEEWTCIDHCVIDDICTSLEESLHIVFGEEITVESLHMAYDVVDLSCFEWTPPFEELAKISERLGEVSNAQAWWFLVAEWVMLDPRCEGSGDEEPDYGHAYYLYKKAGRDHIASEFAYNRGNNYFNRFLNGNHGSLACSSCSMHLDSREFQDCSCYWRTGECSEEEKAECAQAGEREYQQCRVQECDAWNVDNLDVALYWFIRSGIPADWIRGMFAIEIQWHEFGAANDPLVRRTLEQFVNGMGLSLPGPYCTAISTDGTEIRNDGCELGN